LHRLAGRDVVPFDLARVGPAQHALLVSSVLLSETIIADLPRTTVMTFSSQITLQARQREVRQRR
jgi:hypothetical protein